VGDVKTDHSTIDERSLKNVKYYLAHKYLKSKDKGHMEALE
jgi:hypothetical protein